MPPNATSDSRNPSGGVKLPISVHDEADSVATESSSGSGAIDLHDEADSVATGSSSCSGAISLKADPYDTEDVSSSTEDRSLSTEDPSHSTEDPFLGTTANGFSVDIPNLRVNGRILSAEDPSPSTEYSSLSTTANGSSVNIPILRVNGCIHEIQTEVLPNGLPRVIPSWLNDFEFFYNTVDWTLPENAELLMEVEGKPCFARLTIRGECILMDLKHAKGMLQRVDRAKVTKYSLEERVIECGDPERAKLELGDRVYVGSTVLLLRVLEETTSDSV